MTGRTVLSGARVFDGTTLHDGLAVVMDQQRIAALAPLEAVQDDLARDDVAHMVLGGGILSPGFVDLQVNGGGGVLFNDRPDVPTLQRIAQAHAGLGATTIMPTLITDTADRTLAAIAAVCEAMALDVPGIGGLHLEGPHIAPARKGAHDPGRIREMDDADLAVLLGAARRLPTLIVTLAPESVRPEQIAALAKAGVTVSLGHSDCSLEQAQAAFGAGARMVTHLFNAMSQLGSRAPGLVGAALGAPGVSSGIIADLVHVHPATLQVALAADAQKDGLFLVSDAMAPAGSAIDAFTLTGQRVFRRDRTLRLGDGTLAGADLDLPTAVRNLVGVGVPLERALSMATRRPARAAGVNAGVLQAGCAADLVYLSDALELCAVWQRGQPVPLSPV
ncbi:N-acetylglucosamine-6-phosphate deacetylase [Puniceibacterium confluentis]|uniref:N-acetylglucosamine-6-phosphate deacetylase n=1 Tax=Puniceibacterium confluentis TaxID=1958944 RepID=UPI0011B58656|nr:N-acetylglucosamine-6-phosphate deacetylase [Puniceibacterium confluentis]